MPFQRQIDSASHAINNSFFDYYQHLVNCFDQSSNHSTFASHLFDPAHIIDSTYDAICYMIAYGWQHYQSMQHLLHNTIDVTSEIQHSIRLIDYGSGQGIATLAFMDYLAQNRVASTTALEVHLIEPSKISVGIAVLLIKKLAKVHGIAVSIHCQICTLGQASLPSPSTNKETFHLLSNIIDMHTVHEVIAELALQMKSCSNQNFLLATSHNTLDAQVGYHILRQEMDFVDHSYEDFRNVTCPVYDFDKLSWTSTTFKQRALIMQWGTS
ncbi:hypothetical protein [Psychrobacter jeotgali]|uniref:hypothetical protein n=1 Tax=Psychrobacter jeotgali TaxID=179010 RepID=UPI001919F100|nr:hypothetical protein [Psychrobacter jeotgali]